MSKEERKSKLLKNINEVLKDCNDTELLVIANIIIAYLKK